MHEHWSVSDVASALGVSQRTVDKWLARYRTEGLQALSDRCSIAHCRPHALAPSRQSCLGDRLRCSATSSARVPFARGARVVVVRLTLSDARRTLAAAAESCSQ